MKQKHRIIALVMALVLLVQATIPAFAANGGRETSTRFGNYTEINAYDAASNPTTFRNATNLPYNVNNQRTGPQSYVYDGNGNPTTYSGKTAVYDHFNRLTSFPTLTGGNTWSAAYRADGLRAWTKDSTSAAKVYHYYDGGNSVLERYNNGTIVAATYYAPDGLVSRQSGSTSNSWTYHFLFDGQGNAVHTLDNVKKPYVHMAYNAWGQRNYAWPASPPADVMTFGYNARWGYRTDNATGLIYCQNRYYDPGNGRWLTRDPISYAGGINLYGYCGSGPVGAADPRGLWLVPLIVGAGALYTFLFIDAELAVAPTGLPGEWERIEKYREDFERKQLIVGCVGALFGGAAGGLKAIGKRLARARKGASDEAKALSQQADDLDALGQIQNAAKDPRIPPEWTFKKAKRGGGVRRQDPNNPHNSVRFDPKGGPHVHVVDRGTTIGADGLPFRGSIKDPERHIPLDAWQKWREWNVP